MPASVPPGYTRGPLLFFGAPTAAQIRPDLLQTIWTETGAYGTRLLILAAEPVLDKMLAEMEEVYRAWECDQVEGIRLQGRADAANPAHVLQVQNATGIMLLAQDPLRLAATLGGTPLAKAIRRANARSKAVAGVGGAATFLCQHLLAPGHADAPLRHRTHFAPGLGLINRLLVDASSTQTPLPAACTLGLLAALAINPYLAGVALEPDTAAILYPEETLQVYGVNGVTVADATAMEPPDLDLVAASLDDFPGARVQRLEANSTYNTYNLITREFARAEPGDSPPTGPVTSVF